MSVTDPQRKVIGYIEDNLKIKFEGTTMEEAKVFIKTNMDASKKGKIKSPEPEDVLEKYKNSPDDYYFGGSV